MALVENYEVKETEIGGVMVKRTTYKIGDMYHCIIANLSPGANIARASGDTLDAAVTAATQKATRRVTGG